jgi:4-alpha-glucanotransferase
MILTDQDKKVGTLLPMTALVSRTAQPGSFAAGQIFVDWLAASRQRAWQVLPLHQTQLEPGSATRHVPSPYKGYGVGLDPRFLSQSSPRPTSVQLTKFSQTNRYWLADYSLFCALRDHFRSDDWTQWPSPIRDRQSGAVKAWQKRLADQIKHHSQLQCQLHLEYHQLKTKARRQDILLIGDLPFYLSLHSPLVWRFQSLFVLTPDKKLPAVSGSPARPTALFGRQVWGHPLYRFDQPSFHQRILELFQLRFRYLAQLFDLVRIDYVKGFYRYGSLDRHHPSRDQHLYGPGDKFLLALTKYCRQIKLDVYGEDLGPHLKKIRATMVAIKMPGVRIWRHAYNHKQKRLSRHYCFPQQYPRLSVVHTTNHDTQPLLGFCQSLSDELRTKLTELAGGQYSGSPVEMARFIRTQVINSPSKMILIPLQDWLLTTDRINTPGTEQAVNDPNWRYQMTTSIEDLPTDLY